MEAMIKDLTIIKQKHEISKLEKDKAHLIAERDGLKAQIKDLQEKNTQLQTNVNEQKNQINSLNAEKATLQEKNETLENNLQAANAEIENANNTIAELKEDINNFNKENGVTEVEGIDGSFNVTINQ